MKGRKSYAALVPSTLGQTAAVCAELFILPHKKSHSHTQFDLPEQKSILHHHNCRPPSRPRPRGRVCLWMCVRDYAGGYRVGLTALQSLYALYV